MNNLVSYTMNCAKKHNWQFMCKLITIKAIPYLYESVR